MHRLPWKTTLGEAFACVPAPFSLFPAHGFRVVVEGKQKQLNGALLEDIYQIGREAILNAWRHARASDIEMQVQYRYDEFRLAVCDNGRGMDSDDLWLGQEHLRGFRGMRERADRIGGRLRVFSRSALGTEVELCVPGRTAFALD